MTAIGLIEKYGGNFCVWLRIIGRSCGGYEEAKYDAVIARKFVKPHFFGYFGLVQGIQATNTGVYFRK